MTDTEQCPRRFVHVRAATTEAARCVRPAGHAGGCMTYGVTRAMTPEEERMPHPEGCTCPDCKSKPRTDTESLFSIDGGVSLCDVLDYKPETFAESMANTTDEQLEAMEERGDYYTARAIRCFRPAAQAALKRAKERETDTKPDTE